MMIKLTKHADAFWSGNGFGNDKAEWVVKGAEYLHVWAGNAGSWNVTNRETGERVLRNQPTRAFALELLEEKMPALAGEAK
tara:strand:+ start:6024 stop:6266 length:243 start_codon:yes stop_codon:yes gene_type:complete